MSCSRHDASSGFMPLANRFASLVPGLQTGSLGYVTQKEAHLLLDSADSRAMQIFTTVFYLSLSSVLYRLCAFVFTTDCSARRNIGFELPVLFSCVLEACLTHDRYNHRYNRTRISV